MDSLFPTIWNVFHDGSIESMRGHVPGSVTIDVAIEYLRKRFEEPGDMFRITIPECKFVSFREYDKTLSLTNLSRIEAMNPGILNAEMVEDACRIYADNGILEFGATDGSLAFINGRQIALAEICRVATEYWTEWEQTSRRKQESEDP